MYDKDLIQVILSQIQGAIHRIIRRFKQVKTVNDFTDTENGLEKLDSICMLLIAIGESLKNIDKRTHHKLLPLYQEIDWKGVKGMRDIITHHYFDIDAEQIFWVCKHQIQPLLKTIEKIQNNLNQIK